MKLKIFMLYLMMVSCFIGFAQKYKKYPIKSGKIEYKVEGNTKGTQTLIWDDYGYKEKTVENSVTKMLGQTNENKSTTLYIGSKVYSWEPNDDFVTVTQNPIAESWEEGNYDDDDIEEFAEETIEALGYTKAGKETVCGKNCDVWTGIGKIWVWKGLNIKTDVKLLGTRTIITATDIDTNIRVSSSTFDLPDGKKVMTQEDHINQTMQEDNEKDSVYTNEDISEDIDEAAKALKSLFGGN